MNNLDLLVKYKNMLDQNIITEEEFDQIKKKLLEKESSHSQANVNSQNPINTYFSNIKFENIVEYIKVKKKWFISILIIICLLSISCVFLKYTVKKQLVGSWYYEHDSLVGTCRMTYEFREDNSLICTFISGNPENNSTDYCTYKIFGKWITIKYDKGTNKGLNKSPITYKFDSSGRLNLTDTNMNYELTKCK